MVHHDDAQHNMSTRCPHLSHRSDIVRLQVLEEYGGVYIDHDTLVLRSLKPLYHQDFVLGREGVVSVVVVVHGHSYCHQVTPCSSGAKSYLNNGIIVSRPKAPFAMRLVSQYAGYNTSSWYGILCTCCTGAVLRHTKTLTCPGRKIA